MIIVSWILKIVYYLLFIMGAVFCYFADKAGMGGGIFVVFACVCWGVAVLLLLLEQKLGQKTK